MMPTADPSAVRALNDKLRAAWCVCRASSPERKSVSFIGSLTITHLKLIGVRIAQQQTECATCGRICTLACRL